MASGWLSSTDSWKQRLQLRTATATAKTSCGSVTLELQVIQLDARRTAEERDRHSHLSLVGKDFLDGSVEISERSFGDRHRLADEEWNLLLHFLRLGIDRHAEDAIHFFRTERLRQPLVPDELDDALNAVDGVSRLLVHHHLDENVPRIDLPLDVHLLAVLDLHRFLRRHESLADRPLFRRTRITLDPALDERLHLVLVTRRRLDRVPAVIGHDHRPENSAGSPCTSTS